MPSRAPLTYRRAPAAQHCSRCQKALRMWTYRHPTRQHSRCVSLRVRRRAPSRSYPESPRRTSRRESRAHAPRAPAWPPGCRQAKRRGRAEPPERLNASPSRRLRSEAWRAPTRTPPDGRAAPKQRDTVQESYGVGTSAAGRRRWPRLQLQPIRQRRRGRQRRPLPRRRLQPCAAA